MKEETIKKYLCEEKINFESDGEKGDATLKCPSCGLDNFAHSSNCELEINRIIVGDKNGTDERA